MNLLRSLFRVSTSAKKLVGKDKLGNKYFEVASDTATKPRRFVESPYEHTDYEAGSLPIEWEAWVRGNRMNPPTIEEIAVREHKTLVVKKKALDVEHKDKELQQKEYEDGLVATPLQATQATGHASFPMYGKIQSSEQPVSTGKEFEPGSWSPPTKPK